ncbi:MAG: M15 family metallopeptidase [Candidatus Neomarinimicrobiota bacterium]
MQKTQVAKYFAVWFLIVLTKTAAADLPGGFVYVTAVVPDIVLDIRYSGNHNFLGTRVDGYDAPVGIVTEKAALALAEVQQDLKAFGFGLKLYDAYRPQRAVDHFVRWATDFGDTLTKKEFYPTLAKPVLLEEVYIATRSSHTRGSAVDLTIVPLPVPYQPPFEIDRQCDCSRGSATGFRDNSIDMGSGFDCFHEISHTANPNLTEQQRTNRLLLKSIMEKYGFKNYAKEWWHFNYRDEPFPDTYFDFIIE